MMAASMRVDQEHKRITIGVGELAAPPDERVRGMGGFGALRAELGRRAHDRYREDQDSDDHGHDEERSQEVTVSLTRAVDGYEATVRGRIDLLRWQHSGPVVEEIKSVMLTAAELDAAKPGDFSDARLQARLYALCLEEKLEGRSEGKPEGPVDARVVLLSLSDGTSRTISADYDRQRTSGELDEQLRLAVARAKRAERRAALRRDLAEQLVFPYPEARPHQLELSEIIATALAAGQPVLATAPTGIGKTVSALWPALRYGLENDRPVIFVTAKGTQQRLAAKTFEALAFQAGAKPGALSAVTLRAKERMCPEGSLQCHPERCPFLTDFEARQAAEGAVDHLIEGAYHLDADRVFELGEELLLCPYELSMQLVKRVELVIGDYNYAFHPAVSLGSGPVDDRSSGAVVVVDEAHNLFDWAREYYSPFVTHRALGDVVAGIERMSLGESGLRNDLILWCESVREAIVEAQRAAGEEERRFVDGRTPMDLSVETWSELATSASELQLRYGHHNWQRGYVEPADPVMQVLEEAGALGALVGSEEPELVGFIANGDARGGRGSAYCASIQPVVWRAVTVPRREPWR